MRISIFTKVFLLFLMMILPLYALGIALANIGQNQIKKELMTTAVNHVNFYVSNIENEIRKIIIIEAPCINDTNINELSDMDTLPLAFDTFQKIENISRELAVIKDASSYIQETYVLFPRLGLKITDRSRLVMTEEDYHKINDLGFINGYPFNTYQEDIYINFTSEYYMEFSQPENIKYAVVVRLNKEKIANELSDFFSPGKAYFIGMDNGLHLTNGIPDDMFSLLTAYAANGSGSGQVQKMVRDGKKNILIQQTSEFLRTHLFLIDEEKQFYNSLYAYRYWVWILTGTMLTLLVLFTFWTRKIIDTPLNKLIGAIKRGIEGHVDNTLPYKDNEEFGYIYRQFNEMLAINREAVNKIYEKDLLIKDSQLKTLQYQISPHFLYNCFFLMYQMVQAAEYDLLRKMLFHMGNYFNYVTKSDSLVFLENEIQFCADYMEIQALRFSNRIKTETSELPARYGKRLIPRLVIQPLLENSFKHGLYNKEENGVLRLRFMEYEGDLWVLIDDNGDELTDEKIIEIQKQMHNETQMSGLRNVHRRLRLHFGEPYGLEAERSEIGGLLIKVRLPGAESGGDDVQSAHS